MEMSVFDTTTSPKVSLILSKYLHNLILHTPPPLAAIKNETIIIKTTTPQRQQLDLSQDTLPRKCRDEVQSLQTSQLTLLADNYRKRASISSTDVGWGETEDLDDSSMNNLDQQYIKVDFDNLDTSQRMEVKSPRKLEKFESMAVYKLMKAQLNIETDDDNADGDTLLSYALDLVDGGHTVGVVIEEIEMMEMSVCNAVAAKNVALVLSKFLYYLRSSSGEVIDVSSVAMTTKHREDLQSLRSSAQSLRVLTDNYIRRASVSSCFTADLEDVDDSLRSGDGLNSSARATMQKNRDEVHFIRKSSTSSLKQKSDDYVRKVSSSSSHLFNIDDSMHSSDGEIDVSAQAMTRKYRDEVQFLRSSGMSNLNERTENYSTRALNCSAGGEPDYLDISDYSDRGHLSSSSKDFDALSMAERMDVTACRKLTTSETMSLYKMMKANLNVVDDESDEDGNTLLDYALDIMEEGNSVGTVIKEVSVICFIIAAIRYQ